MESEIDVDLCESKTSDCVYAFKPFSFSLVTERAQGLTYKVSEHTYRRKPKPRSGHRMITDGKGNLYCYGGYNPAISENSDSEDESWNESQPLFKEVWKYNIAKGSWRRIPAANVPDELVSCFSFFYKNCITVFGGTGYPFGAFSSNSVVMCDVTLELPHFDELKIYGELPSPQYGQGCVLDKSLFYTVGGTNGYDYSSDVHRLNLHTGQWELLYRCTGKSSEPFGRYRHELAYDGQRIFLLGGGTVDLNATLDYLPVFYINHKKWDLLKTNPDPEYDYPCSRKYHSCVKLPNQIKFLIIGGYDGTDALNDCWLLDLNSLSWKYLSTLNLPLATYFHSSSITPAGKLYTYGGVHHRSKNPERTSCMFSAWLGIPRLQDICWDAIKHYNFTEHFSKSELQSLGVPVCYINEIE